MDIDTQAKASALRPGPALATLMVGLVMTIVVLFHKALDRVAYELVERGPKNNPDRPIDDREAGNVITDNLAMIVFGVIAVVALGALISGLGQTVINWVTAKLTP